MIEKKIQRSLIIVRNAVLFTALAAAGGSLSCGSKYRALEKSWASREAHIPESQEIFSWIKDISSFGYRRPGTPASEKTARYILRKFDEFGLTRAHLEPVQTHAWNAESWGLTIDGERISCYFMPNTMRVEEFGSFDTGPGGLDAEIVYVGDGTEDDYKGIDVKGKIVISDIRFYSHTLRDFIGMGYFTYDPNETLPFDWEHVNPYVTKNYPLNYYRAQKHGASGFIGILTEYIESDRFYNEDLSLSSSYGSNGPMKIPGLYVTRSVGEGIVKSIKAGSLTARLDMAVSIKEVTAYNVLGYLPGKSEDTILIHSHHDAAFTGAVEDASGVSIVMALAKYFGAAPPGMREKTLLFATLDTHSFGYAANKDFIRQRKENGERIILDVCAEHIGLEAKNDRGKLVTLPVPEPRGIIISENRDIIAITKDAVIKNNLERFVLLPTYSVLGVVSDAFHIHNSGIPVVSLISGPIYIYDIDDTPDKVAVDQLRPVTSALIDIIERVEAMPPEEITSEDFILSDRIRYYIWLANKIVEFMIF